MTTYPQIKLFAVLAALFFFALPFEPVLAQEAAPSALTVGFVMPAAESDAPLTQVVARHFAQGLEMGLDEFAFNAGILGVELEFIVREVSGPDAAAAALDELVEDQDAAMVVGALDTAGVTAMAERAAAGGVPLLNIGSSSDALRNELCNPYLFHLEPSAGMYLDAIAGWYVRAGFRQWFFVVGEDAESQAQLERVRWSLQERHFGAREVGTASIVDGVAAVMDAVERANPSVVLLLAPTEDQLELLAAMDERGLDMEVTGYPYQDAQTRAFFERSAEAAPVAGSGRRASAWEPTLDAYGARELNARYQDRFGEPMESPAWAAFQAAKMVFEASALGGATEPEPLAEFFRSQESVFDLWKGIGVTFRPWNQQLRQPLYLIKIVPDAASLRERGLLVGELPAIYMPQTDPVERLDQLGDLPNSTECNL